MGIKEYIYDEHWVRYIIVESLPCTPETKRTLYANYTCIKIKTLIKNTKNKLLYSHPPFPPPFCLWKTNSLTTMVAVKTSSLIVTGRETWIWSSLRRLMLREMSRLIHLENPWKSSILRFCHYLTWFCVNSSISWAFIKNHHQQLFNTTAAWGDSMSWGKEERI